MSHSPALESSPAATTPSTPVLRSLVANERNLSRSPPHSRDDRFLYQPEKVKEYQDRENNSKRDSHNASEREKNRDHHSDRDSKRESTHSDTRREQHNATSSDRESFKRDSSHYNLERESRRDESHSKKEPHESYNKRDSHGESIGKMHGAQERERLKEHQNLNLEREKYSLLGEFVKEDGRHGPTPAVKGSQRLSTGLQVSMAAANAVASFSSTPLHGNFSTDHQWYGVSQQTPPGGAPHSPGAISWGGEAPGATSSDKSSETGAPRLSRKESYKAQRQHYRKEKKRAASALLSSLEDPAVVILADWLKVRGSLKSWTKLWCVLKPGLLLLYKSSKAKSNHWVGTVLLSACKVIERPSKKDGFCFKLYHPLEQSIWAPRGPHNETIGAVVQPLPTAHLIFRAPSQAAGKCWLDGLELALKSSTMLLRCGPSGVKAIDATANHETQWSPEDLERHFHEHVVTFLSIIAEVDSSRSMCSPSSGVSVSDSESPQRLTPDWAARKKTTPTRQIQTSVSLGHLERSIAKWRTIVEKFVRIQEFDDSSVDNVDVEEFGVDYRDRFRDANKIMNDNLSIGDDKCFDEPSTSSLEFFKKNVKYTSSLRSRMFKTERKKNKSKLAENASRSLTVSPMKNNIKIKLESDDGSGSTESKVRPIVLPLGTPVHSNNDSGRSSSGHRFLEDNLMKIVSAFPRRSSTPSAFLKVGFGEGNKSVLPSKSDFLFAKYKHDVFDQGASPRGSCNELSKLKSFLNVGPFHSGRKSAEPRIDSSGYDDKKTKINSISSDSGGSSSLFKLTKPKSLGIAADRSKSAMTEDASKRADARLPSNIVFGRPMTPERFSLIDLGRLPSSGLPRIKLAASEERQSQLGLHVAGKVLFSKNDLDGADVTESDSDVPQALDETELDGSVQPLILASGQRDPSGVLSSKAILDRVVARLNVVYADELNDDVGQSGEVMEELGEENKSLLWFLVKQVRPGMDLSKVVLPTFILEPRSFLDKLSDSFYHSDILCNAWRLQDPFDRMKTVVTWYLSGLYRKPRGLKKPYNPVLGETFRCCWLHPQSNTRTYFVSEQVSHHPPISAFYVSNRKEGFAIEASILAKSKFYGNSTSAILDGTAKVTLLPLGETYHATSPYAHCKGLLVGTLTMELGGRVTITCPTTGHSADIEFKLKPFIGGADSINMVSGRIRHNKDTLATIEGHWDGRIDIKDRRNQEESVLLDVAELKGRRLTRQLISQECLGGFESQRLWQKVSTAIANEDQVAATEEKTIIEEAQRERARGNSGKEWEAHYFKKSQVGPETHDDHDQSNANNWLYINPDFQPWDDSVDILEYESDYVIRTLRRQPGSNLLLVQPVIGGNIITDAAIIQGQDVQMLETERSASETDSTNSHHRRTPVAQGQQSVTAALLRMESALREQATELAGVRAVVERLDTPHRQQYRNVATSSAGIQHRAPHSQPGWPRTGTTILNALAVLFVAYVLQTCGNWVVGR